MERLIITKLEKMYVDNDYPRVVRLKDTFTPLVKSDFYPNEPMDMYIEEKIEMIEYVNADGENIKIGWTKDVADVLGMPIRAIKSLQENIDGSNNDLYDCYRIITELEEDNDKLIDLNTVKDCEIWKLKNSWIDRLKFLFDPSKYFKRGV